MKEQSLRNLFLLCLDMIQGSIGDMVEMGIIEFYQVKK